MQIREIMSSKVKTIKPTASASAAWSRMQAGRIRHLAVMEGSRLVGILSERDLGGRGGAKIRRGRTVGDLMTPRVVTVGPDTTLRKVANLMRGRMIGSLPVLDDDRLVGIVTATDVLDELGRGSVRPAGRPERRSARMSESRRQAARRPAMKKAARARGKMAHARGKAGSRKRRAIPGSRRDASRSESDRADASPFPSHIRAVGVEIGEDDHAYIRRKLGQKLRKFGSSIKRASVRLEDVNGPRGGFDQNCRIKVVLAGLPSVVFEKRNATTGAAVDGALDGVERAVRRSLQRRRMKPIKRTRR